MDLNDALSQFDDVEANLARIEKVLTEYDALVPEGVVFAAGTPEGLRADELAASYDELVVATCRRLPDELRPGAEARRGLEWAVVIKERRRTGAARAHQRRRRRPGRGGSSTNSRGPVRTRGADATLDVR